jgi:predicted ATPase/class 3 adenylate cyclase
VTFLFTDLEGSTALWDRYPDLMPQALAVHDVRIRRIVDAHNGYVFTTAGDSFAVAFSSAQSAVMAAFEIQRSMSEPAEGLDFRVRIGVHSGTATLRDGDYFGGAVNRAARVEGCAHGRQIVISERTVELVGSELPDGSELLALGTHRMRGLVEAERIYQLCHDDLPRDFPPLRTLEGPADSLPTQLTTFVGREREVADVVSFFAEHRMITLSGSGGAGKTRLAIRSAEALAPDFPDGIRFAELGAIIHSEVLTDEIAQLFAVSQVADVAIVRTIAEAIADRNILLVLDNCEQIVADVAALCRELLVACPNLHVLATSRERLGVGGEVLYRVPSLALPEPGSGVDASMAYDAVRLFVERSQLVSPSFEVTADNVDDIASICRHLDGIPLALELAAARIRSMSPAQILHRLGERFRLLTGSSRIANIRQETLLSTIEWGHDLLSVAEQVVFRRLGVFADDFSLEACERVVADELIDELDVIDIVTALVDKSMVATELGADGTTRYHLLETIREFARRRLDLEHERQTIEGRHAAYFAEVAEELQAMQRQGNLAGALANLDLEESSFRSALRFTLYADEPVTAARLIGGLGYLWYASGQHREGLQWCTELFESDPELPDPVRAGALHSYASILGSSGHPKRGIAVEREQVEIRRRLGDPLRLGAALNNLADLLCDVGEFGAAEPCLTEAVELLREAGVSPSMPLSTLGCGYLREGRYEEAAHGLREALREARQADNAYSIAISMAALGECLAVTGQHDEARGQLVEARERFEELSTVPGQIDVDLFLGVVDRAEGHPVAAARHLLAALNAPGENWVAHGNYWIMQVAASVIDDAVTAATLVGAASAAYERTSAEQPAFIVTDLLDVTESLRARLGADEFGRHARTGGRRTYDEAVAIAREFLAARVAKGEHE